MKHVIGKTNNGVTVYVDLISSQAANQISRQPYLLNLLKELVERTVITGNELQFDQDMGRPVGHESIVETSDTDTVIYAQKLKDDVYTRFVKNAKPKPTQHVTLILQKNTDDEYELIDTWIGRLSPPRPGSKYENAESIPYWATHAYVLDGEPVQSKSITKDCPY
ncbi:MAG TPA: hypothetical protein VF575_01380 [Candidatus Saccharimonadales bacterium]|jgi:hypothetical protein